MATPNTNFKSGNPIRVTMLNSEATATITARDFVKIDQTGHGVLSAGNGANLYGIARTTALAGKTLEVEIPRGDIYEVTAATAVDFDMGDDVYLASATTVDAGSTSDIAIGKVVDKNPASAGKVLVAVVSSIFTAKTHA